MFAEYHVMYFGPVAFIYPIKICTCIMFYLFVFLKHGDQQKENKNFMYPKMQRGDLKFWI